MARYILRRLVYIIFTLLIVSAILFGVSRLMPGDPALMMVDGRKLRPEQFDAAYKAAREKLGLDKPIAAQYFSWLKTMATGDFGWSSATRLPVAQMAAAPLGNTVKLNIFGLIFTFLITIPLGVATAVRKGKAFDQIAQVVTIIGYSLPTFIFGLLFICLFGVIFPIFPISGTGAVDPALKGWAKAWADCRYMALPLIVYVFSSLGGITRYVRAAMIDALRLDCIRTARAKGLSEKVVVYSHAFRNSLIPFVTIFTGWFISIFGGSVVIERTFNWNGIGNVLISSLMQQDYAVALAFYSFYAVLSLAGNLIMDIGYCLVDPRVRLS
jgi:peptide/nickel transport system permease protein